MTKALAKELGPSGIQVNSVAPGTIMTDMCIGYDEETIELIKGESRTEDELNTLCLDLPRYKRPRKIIFAEVPRNPTGKIEKPKLREIYCGGSLVAKQNEI